MEPEIHSRLRVLYVDDDEEDFILVKGMLAERPSWLIDDKPIYYEVEWISSYDEALDALAGQQYDIYLLDYRLGLQDGLELLREAVTRGCRKPVILMTGQGSYQVDVEAMKAGAADYLPKGELTAAILERTIRYALERKRTEAILRNAQDELERRVFERTQELEQANRALLAEFTVREQVEDALRKAKSELEAHVAERTSQLEAERARLSTIIANAPAAMIVVDKNCRIIFTNPVADILYAQSISYGETFGSQVGTNIYYPDGTPYAPAELPLVRSATHGETQVNLEQLVMAPDGGKRYLLVNSAPILDRKGNLNGAVGIFQDITQIKLTEQENRERATRIEVQHHLMQYREMERLHIAQDMHDGLLQQLIGIHLLINNSLSAFPPDNPQSEAQRNILLGVQETLKQEIQDVRMFCSELRPPTLAPFGLEKAIRSHVENLQSRNSSLRIYLDLKQDGKRLPEAVRLALFRICQELLNNVMRHSNATEAWVKFDFNDRQAVLEVKDNGRGFAITGHWLELAREGHLGLAGVRERAEALLGRITILSKPGEGAQVEAVIPLGS